MSQMRLGERGAECEMLLDVYGPSSCVSEMFGKVAVDRVPACDKAWHYFCGEGESEVRES
jgi:hypothetical protein